MGWGKLPVSLAELCLDTTLRCGQSFRWKKSQEDIWSCAIYGRILSLRQDATHLHYISIFPQTLSSPPKPPSSVLSTSKDSSVCEDTTGEFVRHYLNLSMNLTNLYEVWSLADLNFKKKAPKFTGVRILRQNAWEALVGFICSSNNNIIRISQMMEKLCLHYGPLIGIIDGIPYHDMPSPSALTEPKVEAHLRELGFGYRAKYLYQTAVMIGQHDEDWLDSLRNPESPLLGGHVSSAGEMLPAGRPGYRRAHEELLALQGVGPKVADCVCLMGLGWGEAVPVDTHVWQIAQRDYKFGKGKHRSLTKATYDAVGDHFRSLWGKEAGWAHSVLFAADLRTFSERLTVEANIERKFVKEEDHVETQLVGLDGIKSATESRVKREFEDVKPIAQTEETTTRARSKRQKRS